MGYDAELNRGDETTVPRNDKGLAKDAMLESPEMVGGDENHRGVSTLRN